MDKTTADVINTAYEILGEDEVFTGAAIGADYAHDELPGGSAYALDAVCIAKSTEDVAAVLKLCCNAGVPVTVRGAGTGRAGGSVPVGGGVVVAMGGMNAILGFDESAKTLTVQPGVLLQDVKAEAISHGLVYPPDPGEKTATVGGNAATNAAGPCAVKYGATRDYISDATIVLADGTIAKLSDRPEYADVVGSEGVLAVITELTLKLVDKPKADVTLLLPFADAATCVKAAGSLKASDLGPDISILEYLDTDMVEFSGEVTGNPLFPVELDGDRVAATLMVTLEGESDDELDEKMEAVAELSEELECLDILVVDTPTMKRDVWAAHDAFHTSIETGAKCACEVNASVPVEALAEYLAFGKNLGEEKGLTVLSYAHAGSGGVHIYAVSNEKDGFAAKSAELLDAAYKKCAELGGCIAGEYGVGYAKRKLFKALSSEKFAKLSALKIKLDPKGILNPGKLI